MTTVFWLMLLLLAVVAPAAAQEQGWQKWVLHVGVGCSLAGDFYDGVSTAYALGKDTGLVEANPLLREAARSPWKLTAAKAAGAAAVNVPAIYWHSKYPLVSGLLLYGNCAVKLWVGSRNERLVRARALRVVARWAW